MGETSTGSKNGLQLIRSFLTGAAVGLALFSEGEKAPQTTYADFNEFQQQMTKAGSLPAISGWSLKSQPSAAALADLEQKAGTGENSQDLAAYQTAYIARHWPELLSTAGPRYLVGVAQDPDHLTRTAGFVQDQGKYQSVKKDVAINKAGKVDGIFNADGKVITLNQSGCQHCRDILAAAPAQCQLPLHPDSTRQQQLTRIITSHHETGHLLSYTNGTHAGFVKVGGETWAAHAEETLANTYASLRLVRQLGLEGVAFLPLYRQMLVLGGRVDAVHHSSRSIESVMTYAGYDGQTDLTDRTSAKVQAIETTIGTLKKMDDRELFDLARQLNRPVSPHLYQAYLQPLGQIRSLPPEQQIDPQNRLVQQFWSTEPDSRAGFEELRDAFAGPARNILVGPAAELNTLGRFNPLRPPSLQGNFGQADYSDPQVRNAMIGYSLSRTPAPCATETKKMLSDEISLATNNLQQASAQKPADPVTIHKVMARPSRPGSP